MMPPGARPERLLLATTNRHKVEEIRLLLAGLPVDLVTLGDLPPMPEPIEDGATFEANARRKAVHYGVASGLLTVAEDSGLAIDALGGAPGVESARFGGVELDYPGKFVLLYAMLRERGQQTSRARFVCAAAVCLGTRVLFETRGTIEGEVAPEPRGAGGFGYDPIFYYPRYGATLAEVSAERKLAVAHRGVAFRRVRMFLADHLSRPAAVST